ncbi:hypothetical protein [Duganella qianjiadongensis]|uniref:Uncharacterized protein n=1 Tax=Duganella qianjiadongensis TaxID=2692176 RepID=A0ABW9VLD5_9BURK|nr:hypothetical protein [Duganella qianjiadongensis]MYM39308.1 hypothetical protein [Duganella qianjiadongensis]
MYSCLRPMMISACLLVAPVASPAERDASYIEDFSCNGGRLGLRLPLTPAGVYKLGTMVQSLPIEVQQWDGYRTTAKALRYRGLTLEIITFSNDASRYLIETATIQHPRWKQLAPFYVGQSRAEVFRVLDVKDSTPEVEQLEFGGDGDTLRFSFRSGKLVQVQYVCYTG